MEARGLSRPEPSSQPSRAHRRTALALTVAASLLAFLAIFAVWANRQVLNTDNWTEASSELLENDAIRARVATFLVSELYANVDVQAEIRRALPPRAAPLARPVANALEGFAIDATDELLARPIPQRLWEAANRRAHRRLVDVVEDRGEVVSTSGGDVTLELKELLGTTQERFGVGGRLEQRLPADAARITILRSDQLGLTQDLVRYLKAAAIVLVVLSLGLFALAVFLASDWRREALRACGVGFVAAGAAALVARSLAGDAVVDALATTEAARPAAEATWTIATSLLEEAAVATIGYGVVIVAAAWLAGPTGAAVAVRKALAPWLREPRFAYGGLAVLVLLVLAWAPTPATRRVVPVLIMVALLLAGLEALRRQTAREHPGAMRGDLTRSLREKARIRERD